NSNFASDKIAIVLDPFRDRNTRAWFELNPYGEKGDNMNGDTGWDPVWEGATQLDSLGWTAEFRIPLSQLRFGRDSIQAWGLQVWRSIARRNESDMWAFWKRNESGGPAYFGSIEGLRVARQPRQMEFVPYVVSKSKFERAAAGDPFNRTREQGFRTGADLKLNLTSALTLDATINPDFGQVEVDPAVVNLSDGETYFDEKRPFFIEGANIFNQFGSGGANNFWGFNNPSPDLFYSRRIGRNPQLSPDVPDGGFLDRPQGTHILGAAKLSGKVGDWSVGTLSALTKRETATIDVGGARASAEVEPFTYYNVTRMLKEFGEGRQGLGFMATGMLRDPGSDLARDALSRDAVAVGIDGWTMLGRDRTWALTGWLGASRVGGSAAAITALQRDPIHYFQRPDADQVTLDPAATSLSGLGGRVTLNKQKGRFYSNTAVAFLTPGFDVNDVGFQWTSDVINVHQVIGYRWRTPTSWYRSLTWNAAHARNWNFGGDQIHATYWTNASMQLRNFYSVRLGGAYFPDRLTDRRTRGGPLMVNPKGFELFGGWDSDDRHPVVVGMSGSVDKFSRGSTDAWDVSTYVEWKPMDRLSLRVSPELTKNRTAAQYVGALADPAATATFGTRYLFADLDQTTLSSSLRVNAIFSPKLSLELYAQPFVSSVKYGSLKALAEPRSYAFTPDGGVGPDGATVTANDFTFASLRGNAVLRWEYLPGSTMYLVWTQDRSVQEDVGDFRMGHSVGQIFQGKANNIFLVKFSYWWNP
ncbi:MAG TPA: DUF5916 domain-containing protein, partial [Gemmatimonadales bacterium]|nr:DUF5916 domain-containing protein [Gemmatimonadales bacterium]